MKKTLVQIASPSFRRKPESRLDSPVSARGRIRHHSGGKPGNDGICKAPERLPKKVSSRMLVLCFMLLVSSCASPHKGSEPLLNGTASGGIPVCFEDPSKIPAFVETYNSNRDLTTEDGKIDYLIERVHASKRTYVRNGSKIASDGAAKFLRWKLNRLRTHHRIQIDTAEDFVKKAAGGSRTTGIPYSVLIPEAGGKFNLEDVLRNELKVLEDCLKKYSQGTLRA